MTAPPPAVAPGPVYESDAEDPDYDRGLWRRVRHVLKRIVSRPLLFLAYAVIPRIYTAYMRFVWATSRIDDGIQPMFKIRDDHDGAVGLLWHEEVFSVAWAYRDFHPHTLASLGDAGEMIARMLVRCGFHVFRGGSAKNRGSRTCRRREVIPDMIEHMKANHGVFYGLTVDGSTGPRYRLKRGGLVIARDCKKPLVVVRTWAKRNIRVGTWDLMAIPLPFNRIHRMFRGPFYVPEDADAPEKLEAFRRKLERELAELCEESYRAFGEPVPEMLYCDYEREAGLPA